ncbi:plasmid replication, integration and excision activator [Janibacter hoylei]|uniref:plasmid replication, integration and excision activator n=1 Tax=Janibacter hoylei TaxID=364298 RepID=UPI0027BA38BE|nr:plasmid replication, integration and excision activator [Janibacter hoylei]
MAVQQRMPIKDEDAFPYGAFQVGPPEAVPDFKAPKREDGSRPQQVDKETGLPVWSIQVLDADPEARKNSKTVTVKLLARQQPVPPENTSGTPFNPVGFTGLTVMPWVEYTNGKNRDGKDATRVAWSFRAEGLTAPGKSAQRSSGDSGKGA